MIIRDIRAGNNLALPDFYPQHNIISTVDVVIATTEGAPYGVLEIDSPKLHQYDEHDINFLTGFANVLAQAVATARRNRTMKNLLDQQKLLAEELQHRVRNNLQMVSGMLHNYARTGLDDTARHEVGSIASRVMTLAQIYDSLLGVGLSDTIDLRDYLKQLCKILPDLHDNRTTKAAMECEAESIMLPLNHVTLLGMIVAELVTNSFRHAFPALGGTIVVTLLRSRDGGAAVLTIQDDGVGFDTAAETERRGIGLVRKLIEQMDGTLEVRSTAGTLWTVAFPVEALAAALNESF